MGVPAPPDYAKLRRDADRLVMLISDPHPDLATWEVVLESVMSRLIEVAPTPVLSRELLRRHPQNLPPAVGSKPDDLPVQVEPSDPDEGGVRSPPSASSPERVAGGSLGPSQRPGSAPAWSASLVGASPEGACRTDPVGGPQRIILMSGPFTYMEMEMLVRRARIQGQDAVALHLAMAREVLMKEEFGDILRHPVMAARIESMIQSESLKASSCDSPPAVGSEPRE
jgi:hypothetical protein